MSEKKDDLKMGTLGKSIRENEENYIESILYKDDKIKKNPLKITIVYALSGGLWILFSDAILSNIIESKALLLWMNLIKGGVYILITAILLYKLISKITQENIISSNKIKASYQRIENAYTKLIVEDKESLKVQYEELNEKQVIIRKSEERYKVAVESANAAIWEVDLLTRDFYCSDSFADIVGCNKEDITCIEDIIKLVSKADRSIAENDFNNHINAKLYFTKVM